MTPEQRKALMTERDQIAADIDLAIRNGERGGSMPHPRQKAMIEAGLARMAELNAQLRGDKPTVGASLAEQIGAWAQARAQCGERAFADHVADHVAARGYPVLANVIRAASGGAVTGGVAGWTQGALAQTVLGEVFDLARAESALGLVFDRPIPALEPGDASVKHPVRTGGTIGGWFGESVPAAIQASAFAGVTLTPKKAVGITVASDEQTKRGAWSSIIGSMLLGDLTAVINAALFGSGAGSAAVPPGLFTDAQTVSITKAAGTDEVAARTDIAAIVAAHVASKANVARSLWLMGSTAWAKLGAFSSFAQAMNEGRLHNMPVATTADIPASSVLLLDRAQVAGLQGSMIDVSATQSFTVEMDTAPSSPMASKTSGFQIDSWCYRLVAEIDWSTARTAAGHRVDAAAWA